MIIGAYVETAVILMVEPADDPVSGRAGILPRTIQPGHHGRQVVKGKGYSGLVAVAAVLYLGHDPGPGYDRVGFEKLQ